MVFNTTCIKRNPIDNPIFFDVARTINNLSSWFLTWLTDSVSLALQGAGMNLDFLSTNSGNVIKLSLMCYYNIILKNGRLLNWHCHDLKKL